MDDTACIICLHTFDDPFFCHDGFTYCRMCIAKWSCVDDRVVWRSPTNNCDFTSYALLVPNIAMRCLVLSAKRAHSEHMCNESQLCNAVQALAIYDRQCPVVPTAKATVLFERLINSSTPLLAEMVQCNDALYALLDGCIAHDRMDVFVKTLARPTSACQRLLSLDRHSLHVPFIITGVWESIVIHIGHQLQCRDSNSSAKKALVLCLQACIDHIDWRYGTCDCIEVKRRHDKGRYWRSSEMLPYCNDYTSSRLIYEQYIDTTSKVSMAVPLIQESELGMDECSPATTIRQGAYVNFFHSKVPLETSEEDHRRMRKDIVAFPDCDPQVEEAQDEKLTNVSHLSILERDLIFLPEDFEYLPRGTDGIQSSPQSPAMFRWRQLRNTSLEILNTAKCPRHHREGKRSKKWDNASHAVPDTQERNCKRTKS